MDIRKLKKIIAVFEESNLSELNVEDEDMSIHMKKDGTAQNIQQPPVIQQPQQVQQVPPPEEHTKKHAKVDENLKVIESPMVGTFYRAPSPTSPPFVEIGDTVKKGQVLCIIEAMKLMNDIESPFDGKIVDILVENGSPVEYGKPLFHIEPN